jgi:RimJ/RimL family protein N-acetyltransferase
VGVVRLDDPMTGRHGGALVVRLREPTLADADLLDRWLASGADQGVFNDFGLPPGRSHRQALESGMLVDEAGGLSLVEVDGEPAGTVTWRLVSYAPNDESVAWNIGIALTPPFRGRGLGARAQRLLAEHLFATTPVNRVEASTDVENVPEQRALEKAGFAREGVLRGAQWRAGSWHDLVSYAILRADLRRPIP